MAIQLNVVGMFFGASLEMSGDQPVMEVLKFAKEESLKGIIPNVKQFSYEVSHPPKIAAISFFAEYLKPFKGRGVHMHYPAGPYFLAENLLGTPSYTVWQYYVQDANKVPVGGGVKFLDNPTAIVPAGGILTWRLVSILKGVNPPPAMAVVRQNAEA